MFFVAGWDGGLKFILLGLSARKSSVLEKICAGTIGKLPVANLARPPDPLADPFPVPRASPVCVRLGPLLSLRPLGPLLRTLFACYPTGSSGTATVHSKPAVAPLSASLAVHTTPFGCRRSPHAILAGWR